MVARHRELQLDDDRVIGSALDLLRELLQDKRFRTRNQLGEASRSMGHRSGPASSSAIDS